MFGLPDEVFSIHTWVFQILVNQKTIGKNQNQPRGIFCIDVGIALGNQFSDFLCKVFISFQQPLSGVFIAFCCLIDEMKTDPDILGISLQNVFDESGKRSVFCSIGSPGIQLCLLFFQIAVHQCEKQIFFIRKVVVKSALGDMSFFGNCRK